MTKAKALWLVPLAAALVTGCGGVPSRGKASDCAGCHAKKSLAAQWAPSASELGAAGGAIHRSHSRRNCCSGRD